MSRCGVKICAEYDPQASQNCGAWYDVEECRIFKRQIKPEKPKGLMSSICPKIIGQDETKIREMASHYRVGALSQDEFMRELAIVINDLVYRS